MRISKKRNEEQPQNLLLHFPASHCFDFSNQSITISFFISLYLTLSLYINKM